MTPAAAEGSGGRSPQAGIRLQLKLAAQSPGEKAFQGTHKAGGLGGRHLQQRHSDQQASDVLAHATPDASAVLLHLLADANRCSCPSGWLAPCQVAWRIQQRSNHLQAASIFSNV